MQRNLAMQGLNVLDFSWVMMGPLVTKWLGDLGATVIKVESVDRQDVNRNIQPMKDGIRGVNRAGYFAAFNGSKYGITINLQHPRGIEVAKRLVAWSDVVIENFLPGVMERFGLAYEDLKRIKRDIIMLRGSTQGQTGPHAQQRGFGHFLQAAAGLSNMLGWPDRPPGGLSTAYADVVGSCYMAIATMAALDYRRRTAKGVCIDVSQLEASVSFLAPAILDYTANGRVQNAMANRCSHAAPHGAYPCRADDSWCVIGIFNDAEWRAFCRIAGDPVWAGDAKFATLRGRKENEEELDRLVSAWTINYRAEDVMAKLQTADIGAGVIQNGRDLLSDRQLQHRGHFRILNHPEIGPYASEMPAFKLSKSPAEPSMPAPCLGEHNEYVCTKILGMSDVEFMEMFSQGVFE